jgi:DDE_Tnp_1-associated
MLSIWLSFADLADPRTGNAQRHNLLDVLTIALTATICGAESCVDFADFGRDREALFREFLDLPWGLPSHDTFSLTAVPSARPGGFRGLLRPVPRRVGRGRSGRHRD